MITDDRVFRLMVEHTLDIITVLDQDGLIRYESPSVERLLGWRPDELVGRSAFDFLHPDDLPAVLRLFEEGVRESGRAAAVELRFRHKDGSWRTLESRAKNMLDDPLVEGVIVNSRDVTERKEAEEALRRSDQRHRALLDALPDAMVRIARDGTYLDLRLPGTYEAVADAQRLIGASAYDVLPPAIARRAMESVERALDTGETQRFEYEIEVGGRRRTREARVVVCGPDEVLSVQRDITEHKRAEAALRESERKFRDLFERSPDAIFVEDLEGRVLDANPAACRLHGLPREALVGMSVEELVPPEERPHVRDAFARLAEAPADEVEGYSLTADGRRVPVEIRGSRITYDGRPALLLHVRDITERHQAAREIERLKTFYEQVLDDLPADVSVMEPDGRIVYLNRHSLKDPELRRWMIGRTGFDYCERRGLDPAIARERQSYIDRAVAEKSAVRFEETLPVRSGEDRHILRIASPVVDEDGAVRQVIGYGLDITVRKRHEAALEASRQQLRELAQHLQSVREEERTRISREVHDVLGQALTALRMDVAWIEKHRDEPQALGTRLDAMKRLIDETVRTVRRIASDLRPGVLDDLGLAVALEWQSQEFERRTGIRCTYAAPADGCDLDRERSTALFRIFQEILTNVARHAGASHVDIRLVDEPGRLVLRVDDDGRGIRDEEVENTTSLGLLGMRERALAWGGHVHLDGRPAGGTTVTVVLPRATSSEPLGESSDDPGIDRR